MFGGKREPRDTPEKDRPMISLAILVRELPYIDAAVLTNVLNDIFGLDLGPADDDSTEFVTGEAPFFILQFGGRAFNVIAMARPYFENVEEVADNLRELRLRKAVAEHRAWIAVDFLHAFDDAPQEDPYLVIGRLLAALAPEDTLALVWPEQQQVRVWDAEIDKALRSDTPLAAFEGMPGLLPVIEVADDDPEMAAAVAEAQRRWPEFVEAFNERKPEQHFAVKVPISDGDNTEFMWLTVLDIEKERIYGKVDNDPFELKNVKYGSRVRVPVENLNDWLYTDGEDRVGGFTVEILLRRQAMSADENVGDEDE
jgi:uncharacterized protein YegJ (DUF2314 family)